MLFFVVNPKKYFFVSKGKNWKRSFAFQKKICLFGNLTKRNDDAFCFFLFREEKFPKDLSVFRKNLSFWKFNQKK